MIVRVVCCVLAVASFCSAVCRGEPPRAGDVQTTRLLEVSVVAETKDGEPVSDLKQEDFELLDAGQPEKISFFSVGPRTAMR